MGVLCANKYGGYTLNSSKVVDITQKIKTLLAIILTILLAFSILSAITANAAPFITTSTNASGDTVYTFSGSESFTAEECKNSVFGGFALKLVYLSYGGLFDVLANSNVFTMNGIDEIQNGGSGIWGLYGILYESVAAVGVGLALMWTLLNIIEKMSEGRMTEELVLSLFAKLLLAAFIILYGKQLCVTLLEFGNAVFNAFKTEVDTWLGGQTADASVACQEALTRMQKIKDGNVFTCCAYIVEGLIPGIAMLACWVLAAVQLISRLLELGIRTAFMPIGVADFMTHGTNSPGMKYLKSYVGCACQGAALYIILVTGVTLMNAGNILEMFGDGAGGTAISTASDAAGRVVLILVIAITMLGLMKRVDNLLREVFS